VNPFLGARPYGPADDRMFFGRQRASATLVERIDLHRLTIVCSPSGLGKTSLLRASVMPQLEKSGLSPVYLRPDPPSSEVPGGESAAAALLDGRLQEALLTALLPASEVEIAALRRICAVAPSRLTLGEAQKWFSELKPNHASRSAILASSSGYLEVMSSVARYLRGSITLVALANQAKRIGANALAALLVADTPVRVVLQAFSRREVHSAITEARSQLMAPAAGSKSNHREDELSHLLAVLQRLCGGRGDRQPLLTRPDGDLNFSARVVLILDQFEQVFTLSSAHTCRRALKLLAGLIVADTPIHIVLALRKEWYADLVQQMSLYLQQPDRLARNTCYLQPMDRAEADEVMLKAPETVNGRALTVEQQGSIWRFLHVDDSIDPVVLSIACHEHFASEATAETIINDAGIDSLFQAYLTRALSNFDEWERNEAIDVLGEISGSESTRGFATHDRLIDAPLADPAVRAKILKGLQDAFLIKGEDLGRSRSKVYDIMHERLLTPVRQLLAQQPDIAKFREAADSLMQEGAWDQGIGWEDCLTLLRARRRISWDSRSAGILLASLLRVLTRERCDMLDNIDVAAHATGDGSAPHTVPARGHLRAQIEILARACGEAPRRADLTYAGRANLHWWMSQQEIREQLAKPSQAQADEFALLSLIQGPGGWMRKELRDLTLRLTR
jgi:hypothetical protein